MKILFFAGGSDFGGLESVTLTLMKELIASGHSAAAIASGWNDGVYPRYLTESEIPFRCIKVGRLHRSKPLWTLDGLLNLPRAAKELKDFVREFCPDVIVHPNIELSFVTLHVLPRQSFNVLHAHDVPSRQYQTALGRYVLGRYRGVISVSNFINRSVVSRSTRGIRTRTVYNGVSPTLPVIKADSRKVRIAIVGRVSPRKRHHVLVHAIKELNDQTRRFIEVSIYGSSPSPEYRENLERLIDEAGLGEVFRWKGFVSPADDIYKEVDILVAPAIDEPFGMTVLEAGAFGIPVIAAHSGALPELIVEAETGLLFSPDDPLALACAIESLANDDALRASIGANARRHVLMNFTAQRMAENFVDALHEIGL
jgi:glycosyltransferase involved in cell wall biosynthesis